MDAEIPTFGEGYRAKLEHLTIEVQAFPERWGYRVIDQNVNPESISFLLMWPASLEDSKVKLQRTRCIGLGNRRNQPMSKQKSKNFKTNPPLQS